MLTPIAKPKAALKIQRVALTYADHLMIPSPYRRSRRELTHSHPGALEKLPPVILRAGYSKIYAPLSFSL